MKPHQTQLLRRIALKDKQALETVMASNGDALSALDPRCAALVRITALLSVDSDPSTFGWAIDLGIASGLEDDTIVDALMVIAPIIGVARLTSTLPHLMAALDLDVVED
jgi:hypothetical protein